MLKLAAIPPVGFIYLFAFGAIFWLDATFGAAVGILLPRMLAGQWQW